MARKPELVAGVTGLELNTFSRWNTGPVEVVVAASMTSHWNGLFLGLS
jgi:hypothetical protein